MTKKKPVPHVRQRLTDAQVRAIRKKSAAGGEGSSDLELAEAYGVHFSWIHRLRRGDVRAEAGGPLRVDPVVRSGSDSPTSVLEEKKVRRILALYYDENKPTTYAVLAEKFAVSVSTISAICNGRKWRRVWEEMYGPRSV